MSEFDLDDLSDLGPSLKAARKAAGLTQQSVAEALDLSRVHVSNIETGQSVGLSVSLMLRMLELYDYKVTLAPAKGLNLNQIRRAQQRGPGM